MKSDSLLENLKNNYKKIPYDKLALMGICANEIVQSFNNLGENVELYKVIIPKGAHLANSHTVEDALKGLALDADGHSLGPVDLVKDVSKAAAIDPEVFLAAAVICAVNEKLAKIEEKADDILNFIIVDEKNTLKTDFMSLEDIHKNFKFNKDNEIYITAKVNLVNNIMRNSKKSLENFYNLTKRVADKKIFINKKDVETIKKNLYSCQLSIYVYAYARYTEVLLGNNYDEHYIDNIINDLEEYSRDYRDFYGEIYSTLERKLNHNVVHVAKELSLKGINKISKDKFTDIQKDVEYESIEKLKYLLNFQKGEIRSFINDLQYISHVYNNDFEVYLDQEGFYIKDNQKDLEENYQLQN